MAETLKQLTSFDSAYYSCLLIVGVVLMFCICLDMNLLVYIINIYLSISKLAIN